MSKLNVMPKHMEEYIGNEWIVQSSIYKTNIFDQSTNTVTW